MRKLIFIFYFVLTHQALFSQQPEELKKILQTSKIDTVKLQALTDLNWIYSSSDVDLSMKYALQELKLANEKKLPKWIAQGYNDIAISFYKMNKMDSSRLYNIKALEIRKELKDSMTLISSYSKLGTIERDLGNYEKALNYQLQALKIAEIKNEGLEAVTLNNISIIFEKLKQYNKAIDFASRAVKKNSAVGNEYGAAQAYGNMAIGYQNLKNYSKSNEYFKKALETFEKVGDLESQAAVYNNLAINLRAEKRNTEALKYYEKALKIAKEQKDYLSVNLYAHNISCVHRDLGNYELAKQYSLESLKNTQNINKAQLLLNYRQLATVYGYLKDGKNVEYYLDKYASLKDSVFSTETASSVAEMEVAYNTEKTLKELAEEKARVAEKERINALNQLKLESRKRWMYIGFILAAVFVFVAIWVYRNQKQKLETKKREFELSQQLEKAVYEKSFAEEKIRISRELHDNIGSHLTFMISSLDNLPYTKDPEKRLVKLTELSNFGRLTMKDLRDTIWAMNHDGGSLDDLLTRINELRKVLPNSIELQVENQIPVHYSLNGLQLLNEYRIVQEALQNTIKYANASRFNIVFKLENNIFQMILSDNGTGFNPDEQSLGNGLLNMKKRCEDIQGIFQVISSSEAGTQIKCDFHF
jgi:signal transduction histidine kinase